MSEPSPTNRKTSGSASFIPNVIERVFRTVEIFAERLMNVVSESADGVVSRAVQKLFGLLLVIVAIAFILSGIAKIINQAFQVTGVGEIAAGALLLAITAAVTLAIRKM